MNEQTTITVIARANLDEDGYLLPSEKWDANVGRLLARHIMHSELNDDHWKVVEYLRRYYLESDIVPPIRKLCRDTGFTLSGLYKLFPMGVARGAAKIAGVPGDVFKLPQTVLYP